MDDLVIKVKNEIKSLYSEDDLEELIELLIKVIRMPLGVKELSRISNEQYEALKTVFDISASQDMVYAAIGNAIKAEHILKKILYIIDRQTCMKIINDKLGFTHVIRALKIIDPNIRLGDEISKYYGDQQYVEHIRRVYQIRNYEAHLAFAWSMREMFENLDSVLLVCLITVKKYRTAILKKINANKIDNVFNKIEEFNRIRFWKVKAEEKECIYCGEHLPYCGRIMLQYVDRHMLNTVKTEGKYCSNCKLVYIWKDFLYECIEQQIDEIEKAQKQNALDFKKGKTIYAANIYEDEME